nr:hypothetical protein orf159 [Navicula sp.]
MKPLVLQVVIANENYVAKPNIAWCADITSFELNKGKNIYAFFCLDVYTNRVIVSLFRTKRIKASEIIKKLNQVVNTRLSIKPRRELIIHTDRGTQFSSKEYNKFIQEQEGFVIARMSRPSKPKDNPVAEQFMRTFKEHKIDGKTFQEELFYQLENNSKF